MLTFLMATGEEGPDLDLFLQSLARVIGPTDVLIVFHSGDAPTLARLQDFAEDQPTQIIEIETPLAGLGDLLRLGLVLSETSYCLTLAPTDRLKPAGLTVLRERLERASPDLCLMGSAWWLADTSHPLPRADAAAFKTLPARPGAAALSGLLPDPRRLVFRTLSWAERAARWPAGLSGKPLYERALTERSDLAAQPATTLLHQPIAVDSVSMLADFRQALTARAKADRAACLTEWAPLLDEYLSLCAPEDAKICLGALPQIAALLPRRTRRMVGQMAEPFAGTFATLLAAQITQGNLGAKAELGMLLAAEQQRRNAVLARAYGQLRQDVDLALPGPDYLRRLYARLRGI